MDRERRQGKRLGGEGLHRPRRDDIRPIQRSIGNFERVKLVSKATSQEAFQQLSQVDLYIDVYMHSSMHNSLSVWGWSNHAPFHASKYARFPANINITQKYVHTSKHRSSNKYAMI